MELNKYKILVTGAGGFIGSQLTEELVRCGYDVRAFILYNAYNSWEWLDHSPQDIKENMEVFSGDIRDPYGVKKAMEGCNVVIHLAALIAIPYSYHSPDTYVDTNIKGTLNVLQAARELEIDKVIHTSTSEVYGTAQFVPITEDHPLHGQSPYSATKIAADQLAMSFYYSFNTPIITIRPFNTYGPRQSARAIIPTVITQIASGKKKIQLGSLHPTRNFNYIKDTVDGFLAGLLAEGAVGEVINIGSNFEVSINSTVTQIANIMNADIEIETEESRIRPDKSEVERLIADNTRAKKIFNWEPKYAGPDGFTRGLTETIAWFTQPQNLSLYKAGIYNI